MTLNVHAAAKAMRLTYLLLLSLTLCAVFFVFLFTALVVGVASIIQTKLAREIDRVHTQLDLLSIQPYPAGGDSDTSSWFSKESFSQALDGIKKEGRDLYTLTVARLSKVLGCAQQYGHIRERVE